MPVDVGLTPNHVNLAVCDIVFFVVVILCEPIHLGSPLTIRRKSGYKDLTQEAPTSQSIPPKNNEPFRPSKRCTGEFGSVRRKATISSTGKLFDRTEMATTVGATLASSKLAVTQGDLHLVGSSVDQLIVQFNQIAFDEFLVADQIRANKARKRHSGAPAAASRSTSPAPSSSWVSTPMSNDGSTHALARSRTYHPTEGKEIPGGSLCYTHHKPQKLIPESSRLGKAILASPPSNPF